MLAITEAVKDTITYYHRLGYTLKVIDHLINSRYNLHIICLVLFSYLNLIRSELADVRNAWNHYRIRKQNIGDVLSGILDLLCHSPEMLGLQDWSHPVDTTSEMFGFLHNKVE